MNDTLLWNTAFLLLGAVHLYFGAEWLVGGASRFAVSMRIPQLTVGLTVVAFGTSAPEVIVGLQSSLGGHPDVAIGNVIGSNIANLGLILGLCVLVKPAVVDGALRGRELPVLLASTGAIGVVMADGIVTRPEALLLIFAAGLYTGWLVRAAGQETQLVEESVEAARVTAAASGGPKGFSRKRSLGLAVFGLAVLVGGSKLFVDGATGMALHFGMSERLVGLTIVAVGTSLPELITSVVAALRGHSDIAIGNVVGSNIFNAFVCLGSAALVSELPAPLSVYGFDLAVLALMTVVGIVFMRSQRTIARWEGALLVLGYAGWTAKLIGRI